MDIRLTTVTLGAPDAVRLAEFYQALLGGETVADDDGWIVLRTPNSGVSLAFQQENDYRRPVWPERPDEQQMMVHLEICVDDLPAGVAHAIACGAQVASFQPQDDVRVCLDPAGHPFCLWVES